MDLEVDISHSDHPECRNLLYEKLDVLGEKEKLRVVSDHDPAPALRQYQAEKDDSLEWSYGDERQNAWEVTVTKISKNDTEKEVDARELPPSERHETILQSFQDLKVNCSLLLINDHDPKPLFYELSSIYGDAFDWEYVKQDKNEYRVKITKTGGSTEMPEEASTRVDVRVIPPSDRHKTIFHRFDLLADGDAMEILADHDPKPLKHQLREIHGSDAFEWEYLQQEPSEVRVLLRKRDANSEDGFSVGGSSAKVSEESLEEIPELDVRSYQPQKRHDLVFERYQSLEDGEAFILVNDHDPKPLYYQMKEEMEGNLRWKYVQQDDNEWKVLIGR